MQHGSGLGPRSPVGGANKEFRLLGWRERDDEPLAAVELHVGVGRAACIRFFAGHFRFPSCRRPASDVLAHPDDSLIQVS